jgi:dihydrofolate synthase/folylpolyglutamate synthase
LSYKDAVGYLDTFVNYERRPPDSPRAMGLERVRWLLGEIGDPHERLKALHIAGTKGKGSTAAMAESILRAAGYRTGLYTSPHLVDARERIRVSGEMIPRETFSSLMERLKAPLERIRRDIAALPPGATLRRPTYFEIMTDLAFLHFDESKVDVAVVEVGMGGRLDATNVVAPLACAVTNVSLDHTAILGSTVAEIAREKAGILKPGVPAVVAPQRPSAAKAIRAAARKAKAPLWWVGREVELLEGGADGAFTVRTPGKEYAGLSVPLWGAHQRQNAAVAVALVELAASAGLDRATPESVREGLARVSWPGRIEKVSDSPVTILDGAHNVASLRALLATVRERFGEAFPVFVFAAAEDKDWRRMLDLLPRDSDGIVVTSSGNPRSVDPRSLAEAAGRGGLGPVVVEPDPARALECAREIAGPDGLVVATGSLYLVGRLLEHVRSAALLRSFGATKGHRPP